MGYVLGVDLGTTYSAAATAADGRADRFPLGNRTPMIPSVVCLRTDGEVLVGEAADRRSLTEPGRTAREFKRRLGDPTPLILGGTPYGAETLSAHLLRWIVAKVTEQHGAAPDAIVLSHPANWGAYKLDLLEQTVRLAEVGPVSFITEPEAAAVHYARQERLEPGQAVGVYDFGGGTFDAAVLRATSGDFELLGRPEGLERIGGIDFDQAIFAHVDQAIGGAISELDPADTSAMAAVHRLRGEVQLAKEQLSQDTDVDIPVLLPGTQTEVRLTRAEFESMIRPRIAETIAALERAIRSAGLTADDMAKVLLVGGTSRIPLVGQMVREATGRPIAIDAHPKFAIAIGAALTGATGTARPAPAEAAATATSAPIVTEPAAPAAPAAPEAAEASPPAAAPTEDADEASEPSPVAAASPPPAEPPPAAAAPAAPAAPASTPAAAAAPVAAETRPPAGDEPDGAGRPAWMYAAAALVGVLGIVGVASALGGGGDDPAVEPVVTASEPSSEPTPTPTDTAPEVDALPPWVEHPAPDLAFVEITDMNAASGSWWASLRFYNTDPIRSSIRMMFDDRPFLEAEAEGLYHDIGATVASFSTYSVTDRPLLANRLCAFVLDPETGMLPLDEDGGLYETGNCHDLSYATINGSELPGDRFVELTNLRQAAGRYVFDYEAHNFAEVSGPTNHLHTFWYPTHTKDTVGSGLGGSWRLWPDGGVWPGEGGTIDDAYYDVANRPADATHICAVVAEANHAILLNEDGLGHTSGTCLALDEE